ncbi:MAG: acyltransferase family protein [Mangrovibacterium sp.]
MKTDTNEPKRSDRLQSLDVLRGFDMFWIIGGGGLIIALAETTNWSWLQILATQMEHVQWAGFHFYDLIFPLFMFISGVAIPYSITAKAEQGIKKRPLFHKILKRGIILVLLGILYNGTLKDGFSTIRVVSVLGQIGLAYLFAATIVLYTKSMKARMVWLIGILSGIAVLQLIVPVPGYGVGLLDPEGGINAWLDRTVLPGRLLGETYDPLGILCIVSATTGPLMGALAGDLLRSDKTTPVRKTLILAVTGAILIAVALVLSPFYPIIKKAWTVPFCLLTAGISFLLVSLFYFLIEVKKFTRGIASYLILFFKVIGMNSITIYLAVNIVDFEHISSFFTGWLAAPLGEWIVVLGAIIIEWLLLYYLYQKKIFLRV